MVDPVVSRYGNSFERSAIFEWLEEGNMNCPVSGQPLRASGLVSDNNLSWKIRCWMHQNVGEGGGDDASAAESDKNTEFHESFTTVVAVVPEQYKCDLTKSFMSDPVMTVSGNNFERNAILKYLEEHETCPVTGKPLYPSMIVTNHALAREIVNWKTKNAIQVDEDLPALDLENAMALLSPYSRKRAVVIGVPGSPAVAKMREHHAERIKKLGLPVEDEEDQEYDNVVAGLPYY